MNGGIDDGVETGEGVITVSVEFTLFINVVFFIFFADGVDPEENIDDSHCFSSEKILRKIRRMLRLLFVSVSVPSQTKMRRSAYKTGGWRGNANANDNDNKSQQIKLFYSFIYLSITLDSTKSPNIKSHSLPRAHGVTNDS